jgi:hypothetical protein
MIFLPADVIGARIRNVWLAFAVAAAVGFVVTLGVDAIPDGLDQLPLSLIAHLEKLIDPVLWLYPAIPLIAAIKLPRRAAGAAAVVLAGGASAAVLALAGAERASAMGCALAGCIALFAVHAIFAVRRERVAAIPALAIRPRRIFRALPLLVVAGGASAYLAQAHRIGGEPLATLLISRGHVLDAAAVALITALAFFPLVAVSSVSADSYTTQGTPDWILGIGYLMPSGIVAALAGGAAMAAEVLASPRSIRLVLGMPVLSECAAAVREAMGDVTLLALLIGGAAVATAVAGPIGFLAVGAAWLLNENLGRPLWRIALAPSTAIVVGLAANAWHLIR